MLSKIADFYDDEVDAAVSNLLSLLEPMMICFLGVVVGGMVAEHVPADLRHDQRGAIRRIVGKPWSRLERDVILLHAKTRRGDTPSDRRRRSNNRRRPVQVLFELDRYFVPKELVLHIVVLFIAILLVARRRTISIDLADALLALFLAWSAASALSQPITGPHSARSAQRLEVLIFWGASARRSAAYRPIFIAGVCDRLRCRSFAGSVRTDSRPTTSASTARQAGRFGNRNFVAHIAAIGLPALVWSISHGARRSPALQGSLGARARRRVGAVAVAGGVARSCRPHSCWPDRLSSPGNTGRRSRRRPTRRVPLAGALGGIVAVALPNRLNWASDSPYLDSLVAWWITAEAAAEGGVAISELVWHGRGKPCVWSGPGNWPVRYVRFAPANDRSLADDGMTANPWPSSDWVAFLSGAWLVAPRRSCSPSSRFFSEHFGDGMTAERGANAGRE